MNGASTGLTRSSGRASCARRAPPGGARTLRTPRFAVGAAVLAADGTIYAGCNVENASYGLTVCAERVAVQSAVAAGRRRLRAVAVAGPSGITPCGACRQVMDEFGVETVILAASGAAPESVALRELLPRPFVTRARRERARKARRAGL